ARGADADLRALLHDQGDRPGPRARDRAPDRRGPRRQPRGRARRGAGEPLPDHPAAPGAAARMSAPFRILVVDDEAAQRQLVTGFLRRQGFDVAAAGDGTEAVARFRLEAFDLVLTDQRMPGLSGLARLGALRPVSPEVAVIVMTAYGTIETAVAAIKAGAADYLTKPLNLDELLHRIRLVRERQRLLTENRELRLALRERHRVDGIVGESGRMQEVLSLVHRVAGSDATVLLQGESGTGKELIARAIHHASPRAAGPLVRVNCAALPESLLETELFGHEKGAFTGAATARQGRF